MPVSITIASVPALVAACAHARSIDIAAYTLRAGIVRDTLVLAAKNGATVRVRIERNPIDDGAGTLHAANAATLAALRAAGADAAVTGPDEPVLHMKAAVVDGVAWLDDRNWAGGGAETVIRDSDADAGAAGREGLAGRPGGDGHLRTTKRSAQYLEANVIASAGAAPLALESESFGSGLIYNALLHRAQAGRSTRLLVAAREACQPGPRGEVERHRLARLAALGVEVRTGAAGAADLDEKLAVVPDGAWVGSTNATYAREAAGRQRDWGLATRDPALVDALRQTFERNWAGARTSVCTGNSPAEKTA
ncbi:MAG: hypothetical protein NVSMB64_05070 [Candidatus Velthaea sp.]